MRKCQCENCQPKPLRCQRVYRENMRPEEQLRFSSPQHWCQCGAWKYSDAPCCSDCWKEQEGYVDR